MPVFGDISTINAARVEFLRVEIDIAMTYLDLAETCPIEASVQRNRKNALKAYATVLYFLDIVSIDPDARCDIDRRLTLLRLRLQAGDQGI
jgi:hypothetical protein